MLNIFHVHIFLSVAIIDPTPTTGIHPIKLAQCLWNDSAAICIADPFLHSSIVQIALMRTPFKISNVVIIFILIQVIDLRKPIGIWNKYLSYQPVYKEILLGVTQPKINTLIAIFLMITLQNVRV